MNLQPLRQSLAQSEGVVPHLYLCPRGVVTVGVGHAIQSIQEALKLALEPRDAIVGDYESVKAATPGRPASYYRAITRARMSPSAIDALLDADIKAFTARVQSAFPNFDSYPDPVQQAMFDMAYNLGVGGLLKYKNLRAALDAGDWKTCAAECHRNGISEARNKATADLFLSA